MKTLPSTKVETPTNVEGPVTLRLAIVATPVTFKLVTPIPPTTCNSCGAIVVPIPTV